MTPERAIERFVIDVHPDEDSGYLTVSGPRRFDDADNYRVRVIVEGGWPADDILEALRETIRLIESARSDDMKKYATHPHVRELVKWFGQPS